MLTDLQPASCKSYVDLQSLEATAASHSKDEYKSKQNLLTCYRRKN